MSGPHEERELKFAAVELPHLRERLLELQAERVATPAFEDNWIFDRGKGELIGKRMVLRLRLDGHGAQLTLKGPPEWEENLKIRSELQTRLEDAEQMQLILQQLGYRVVRRYQKMREEWRIGAVVICLDHTPIGDFAEFEGQGADKLARRCGLAPEEAEPRSYLELYEDHVKANPGAPPDMVFK
ncbi:MAG TPA: class IV adenylate cyclase [Thermoanaerobaculia bacterium]|jgi:predicted adenylyl cyclase CyaB|nr:class IV adenylate cyclase [Thermoanaerobaculia bacterium]